MEDIYISIGSNISPKLNVRASIVALENLFGIVEVSPVYKSSAVGFEGNDFLNLVAAAKTAFTTEQINSALLEIENNQGRDRTQPKFSNRTLDLDLLLYGNVVISQGDMNIPRPEIDDQVFVLKPLADLAPDRVHPVSGYSYSQMLSLLHKSHPESIRALTRVEL